jgi:hypothetical protein
LGYPAHYCLILNQDHLSHVHLLLPFRSYRNAESQSDCFVRAVQYILVYPSLWTCGGSNVFRHLLVQHGAAPLAYPAAG